VTELDELLGIDVFPKMMRSYGYIFLVGYMSILLISLFRPTMIDLISLKINYPNF
jgi:hypothetical protein